MHQPVLLNEAIDALAICADGIYIDGTFGRGGHSQAILKKLNAQGRLLVIDKDPTAISHAQTLFENDARVTICHGSFAQIAEFAMQHQVHGKVNGVLLDLGVSSPQLDTDERGFSFLRSGPLDMRMDNSQGMTAAEWISKVPEKELADVLFQFGEERYSRRIARAIVEARVAQAITTTKELAEIIAKAHPRWEQHKHPATRSFQAIRIYLNNELKDLTQGLQQSVEVLQQKGRLAVISFHSLEDRMVKQFMQIKAKGQELPPGLPLTEKEINKHRFLTLVGKAIKPTEQEIAGNPRARSAVLRIAEKK